MLSCMMYVVKMYVDKILGRGFSDFCLKIFSGYKILGWRSSKLKIKDPFPRILIKDPP